MPNATLGRSTDQPSPARAALNFAMGMALAAACLAGAAVEAIAADTAPLFTKPIERRDTIGTFDPAEGAWRLSETTRRQVALNANYTRIAPAVACIYRMPGNRNTYRSVTLWADSRPDLSQVPDSVINGMNGLKNSLTADIAVSQCPASWGDALTLVWGPTAMDEIKAIVAKREQRNKDREADWDTQQEKKYAALAEAWKAAAAALPPTSAAQDRDLARQIDAEISAMENRIDSLNSKPFDTALKAGLYDRIVRLGQAAYVKSKGLSADGANRARFDAWDRELGGPALLAVKRLENIIYYRHNRRVKLREIPNANEALSEMESWTHVDMGVLWPGRRVMLEIMTQRLAGKQLVSADFLKKVARDLERDRPTGDPGRPFYRFTPVEGRSWTMSSPQQEAEEQSGSTVGSSLINAAGAVGDMVRLIEKADADARQSRLAFWQCYATQCKQAGAAFYAYSHALKVKDDFTFVWPTVSPQMLAPGMIFLGIANIDNGQIDGCTAEDKAMGEALTPAAKLRQSNTVRAAALVVDVMAGPKYEAWRTCRDRMEYIFRPRI